MEALKAAKTAVKDKEAIIRNHAHYKQVEIAVNKDDKKKTGAATATARPAAETQVVKPTPAGKKAAKRAQAQAQAQDSTSKAPIPNKNILANDPLATHKAAASSPSRPQKPPKAPRPTQQGKATSSASTSGTVATPSVVSPSNVVSTDRTPSSDTPQPDNSSPAPRRTRPILGVSSRQFEAALSIAGLASSASERRNREKEKSKDPLTPTTESGVVVSGSSSKDGKDVPSDHSSLKAAQARVDTSEKGKAAAPLPPLSPKKDKSRKGGVGPSSDGANTIPVVVPNILQRNDGSTPAPANLQKVPSGSGAAGPVAINSGGQPRGRRGRGGGARMQGATRGGS